MNKRQDNSWEVSLQLRPSLWSEAASPEGAWVTVVGDSMTPTIAPGTRVHVRAKPVQLGSVIAFATADGKRAVLHRVIMRVPRVPFILQAGDCHRYHGDVGIIRSQQVIGVAELPRKLPSVYQCFAVTRALLMAAARSIKHPTGAHKNPEYNRAL
ncbi:MAG TPA: S24/S26 family peptidase [Polyangiales bacterium]|nr:S24/S26 family peptidase [Polyangiales bacterium]